ncbi:MAG: hypothetical protein JKY85_00350 [Porticoccus sp.]|nr:hypothetical protein [Porticoccus sp.]
MDINIYDIDFGLLIAKAQFDKFTTADYLGVTVKTIERWKRNKPPKIAIRALEFRAGIAPKWEGFYFNNKNCTTPIGHQLSPPEIEQYFYLLQMREDIGRADGIKIASQNKKHTAKIIYLDNFRRKKEAPR